MSLVYKYTMQCPSQNSVGKLDFFRGSIEPPPTPLGSNALQRVGNTLVTQVLIRQEGVKT